MADLIGKGVSPGVAVGPARRMARDVPEPDSSATHAGDAAAETARARAGLEHVATDLTRRGEKAGGEAAAVLSAQALMARDPAIAKDVEKRVNAGATAQRATYDAFLAYREPLLAAGGYLAERVVDLDDVRDRVVAHLLGVPMPGIPESGEPFILVAADLAPADTATLDPDRVLAIVTREGSPTSHTAILARTLGLPAVVACPGTDDIVDGTLVLIDGTTGGVTLDPTTERVGSVLDADRVRTQAAARAEGPGRTGDGHSVALLANIGGPADAEAARTAGAEGVGLFRTEFLFLDRSDAPGHDEQVSTYRQVFASFPGAKVVVRTLDVGADKPLPFLPPPGAEPNPALGVRGLRMMRDVPEVLRGQLAALVEATRGTTVELAVMAPMVTDRADAEWFVAQCRDVGVEQIGVMVEVPALALSARHVAPTVDFFSIGTNDLAQYTCAADRESGPLHHFQDAWQPAVLELITLTGTAAAAASIGCGVCGEAAADPVLACVLVGLGATSLSMAASALPLVRAALASHSLEQCRAAAESARRTASPEAARVAARVQLPNLQDLGL
ncbi:phosphoenolpyruvate--protein phosphotransferase [Spiractinospora alimapuensis]|uniref:phosphoenolpyruvate--protein phosphotransferase n=1 Tax=Spiractinospora alimapuensis TaxID=2820884 RepID=UPI001F33C0E0|nr:phosphoenolpyruvate--protein phosphotransferase [Spiractinospora alimapuensis]QVQ53842.1 phosphoenolpyruvate--protein phosphotransferase [Spiractinospora alimapuensis]